MTEETKHKACSYLKKRPVEVRKTVPILSRKLFFEQKAEPDPEGKKAQNDNDSIKEEVKDLPAKEEFEDLPAKEEEVQEDPEAIAAREREKKLEEERRTFQKKIQEEWDVYRKGIFMILDWDSEYRPKLLASKEIYLMLAKKILNRMDLLSSHNYAIFQFFIKKEKELMEYLKSFGDKPVALDKLLQYYENRVAEQWKIYHLLYKDDNATRDRVVRFLNFLQKSVLPSIKKICLEFHKYFLDQKKLFEDCETKLKKLEEDSRKILKNLLADFDKGQTKQDFRPQATIQMWNLERIYLRLVQIYKTEISKLLSFMVSLWKTAPLKNNDKMRAQNELYKNYFLQKNNSIGGLESAERELLKVNVEEINDYVFGFRKMINTEELDIISRFDTTKNQKPFFEIEELEKLGYDEFMKFLNHLFLSISEPPPMIIAKKRGIFLREVGTIRKKWQPCSAFLTTDYVLHIYDREEDIEPQISLRLRAATIQIQEINRKTIITFEEPIKGLFSFNKKLKLSIDTSEEFSHWKKEFSQAIPP